MRDRFFLKRFVANKEKRNTTSWNCTLRFLRVCGFVLLFIPLKGKCSGGDMLNKKALHDNSTNSVRESSYLTAKRSSELEQEVTTEALGSSVLYDKQDLEAQYPKTDSSVLDTIENAILPEPDYESLHITSSMQPLESTEIEAEEREDVVVHSLPYELESAYDDEEETILNSKGFENKINSLSSLPVFQKSVKSSKSKHKVSRLPIPIESTTQSHRIKSKLQKKVSSKRTVMASSTRPAPKTKRPKKVTRSTTRKTNKVTKAPKPIIPAPIDLNNVDQNPHHPHGVVVFDKRKKRPKPGRTKTKLTTTSTTSTTSTTTSTTTTMVPPTSQGESEDYYDYYWTSGESSENIEIIDKNSTVKNNSTSNKKRISSKIPLSKLAMAMIASSAILENGTASGDPVYYPKSPVNLLNILQSYTKQLQLANGESTEKQPVVQIQSTPFMVHLSQLPFLSRIAISVYYSLIAIIPLVYLAFGGLGRLGFLNAFTGRGFAFGGRRRRRRSYGGDHFHFPGNHRYQTAVMQRADLNERNEDEYLWILGRISEIILEFSLLSNEKEK